MGWSVETTSKWKTRLSTAAFPQHRDLKQESYLNGPGRSLGGRQV